jgi:RNA polymerase sigma factor (sigma-70 family)
VGKTITDVVGAIGRAGRLQAALTLADAQLLERFAVQRDEAAFEALLHRHGPLVFSVCRRLLVDAHDAEDAFQATFLVLTRKAGGIGQGSLLGNWLYGVACKVAARARKQVLRRCARQQAGIDLNGLSSTQRSAEPDEAPLIHEEVQRLPDKYRRPVVLCYLEGKTNEEAALDLQWPVGTVKTRLNKARELLRTRLARRGVALSAGLLAVNTAAPAGLRASTFKAGMSFAAGDAAAGGLASARAVALTKGVLQTMLLTRLKLTAALLLSVVVLGGGIGNVVYNALAVEPAARQDDQAKSPPKDKAADKPKDDKDAIRGSWVVEAIESEGKDASGQGEGKLFKESTWTITEDKMVVKFGTEVAEMKFKLDPAAKPKTIDCTMVVAPNKEVEGKTFPGIYSLEGDTLRIHLPNESNLNRPTELETKEGGGMTMLVVLKRRTKDK